MNITIEQIMARSFFLLKAKIRKEKEINRPMDAKWNVINFFSAHILPFNKYINLCG